MPLKKTHFWCFYILYVAACYYTPNDHVTWLPTEFGTFGYQENTVHLISKKKMVHLITKRIRYTLLPRKNGTLDYQKKSLPFITQVIGTLDYQMGTEV